MMSVNPAWIIALVALALTVLGIVATWSIRINKGESAAESAKKAQDTADKALAELSAFKAHVAETYASNKTLEQMERRLMEALNRLGDRFDRLFHPSPPAP